MSTGIKIALVVVVVCVTVYLAGWIQRRMKEREIWRIKEVALKATNGSISRARRYADYILAAPTRKERRLRMECVRRSAYLGLDVIQAQLAYFFEDESADE